MTVPFVTIKAALYDISTLIPEQDWNEELFMEWAYKGLFKINLHDKFEQTVCTIPVAAHKATLPSDFKYITQIAYVTSASLDADQIVEYRRIMGLEDEEWNPAVSHMTNPNGLAEKAVIAFSNYRNIKWRPLRASSNPFLVSIDSTVSLYKDTSLDSTSTGYVMDSDCEHEYSVDSTGCVTTTLAEGLLLVSYLRYPTDSSGDLLIPNDEDVKDAITHFILYRHYSRKFITTNELVDRQEREYHLDRYQTYKIKVSGKFGIDVDTLENIKAQRDRLVPRDNRYSGFFSQLNKRELENPNMSSPRYY